MGIFSGKKIITKDSKIESIGGPWKHMTIKQVNAYQECLNKVFEIIRIETRKAEQEYSVAEIELLNVVMDEYKVSHDLLFLYVQTMVELYLLADSVIRKRHRNHWVKAVTGYRDKDDMALIRACPKFAHFQNAFIRFSCSLILLGIFAIGTA